MLLPPRVITIPHVHPHSGKRGETLECDVAEFLALPPAPPGRPAEDWLLLFEWTADPVAFSWQIRTMPTGRAGVPSRSGGPPPSSDFVDTQEEGRKLFREFNIQDHNWPPCLLPQRTTGNQFRAAKVAANALLQITVEIDTNATGIAALARQNDLYRQFAGEFGLDDERTIQAKKILNEQARKLVPPVTLSGFLKRPTTPSKSEMGAERSGVIRFKPDPLEPMLGYPGYVAIDLGNTATMLAYMPEKTEDVSRMRFLEFGKLQKVDAHPTAVRLTRYKSSPRPPDDPNAPPTDSLGPMPEVEWKIGKDAQGGTDGLILGSKRLLSDPHRKADHRVLLNGIPQTIPKDLPAELFLARLIQEFHAFQSPPRRVLGSRPTDSPLVADLRPADGLLTCGLAVTCPTTFSDREIDNLKKAVFSGLRRALGEARYYFDKYEIDRTIALVIDEASAAAMFYIYRDFLRGPGFARAIKYLYPTGVNVLIYDCGGGTTDIALVHAYPVYDQAADRVNQLHIDVIGRTGHRSFGGDDITTAVFTILKARIAVILAANQSPKPLEFPTDLSKLHGWIKSNFDVIDKLFPTRFNRANIGQRHVRDLTEAVLNMWEVAERIKIGLEKATTAKPTGLGTADGPLVAYITGLTKHKDPKQVANHLGGITVSRDEVDAVIHDAVHATIDRANGLIRRRLRTDAPAGAKPASAGGKAAVPPQDVIPNAPGTDALPATIRAKGGEVHAVYVLGNASRYPLIRKSLETMLDIPFLQPDGDLPGRLVFEPENLKGAVAKGAVAALQLRHELVGVEVRYDSDLIRRLPFDIWLTDLGRGDQHLYREGQLYEDLTKPREIPAPARPQNQIAPEAGREVTFKRQWPDDPVPTPYLTFRFPTEVVGPLRVEYFEATEDSPPYFQMTDLGGSGASVIGEEEVEALYISPPQSGEL